MPSPGAGLPKPPLTPAQRRRRRRRRQNKAVFPIPKGGGLPGTGPKHHANNVGELLGGKGAGGKPKKAGWQKQYKHDFLGKPKTKKGTHGKVPAGGKGGGSKGKGGGGGGKGGRGGKGGGGGGTSTGGMVYMGMGKPPNVPRRQAALIVGRDINRQVRELQHEARKVQQGAIRDAKDAKNMKQQTKGDLRYLYNEADDYIGRQNQNINDSFNATRGDLQDIYHNFSAARQDQTNSIRDAAMAELQRLGVQQTGMGQFDSDAANMDQVAAQNQANILANNETSQNSSREIGNILQGMSRGSRTSQLGQADVANMDALNQIRGDARGQLMDVFDQIRNVRADRANQVQQLYMQLQQNAYQQWAETNQSNFNNQLAANQFNLDVSQLNSDNLFNKAKVRQERNRQRAANRQMNREWQRLKGQDKKTFHSDMMNLMLG